MKYAVITGGSRGIGKAIALKLATDLEYNIVITYRFKERAAAETKVEIEKLGVRCSALKFDVSDKKETDEILENWHAENPDATVEVVVNNAGVTKDGLFFWMKESDWDAVINTSLKGFYTVTQHFVKSMLKKRYGRIINVASLSGLKGNPGQVNYSAAKAGLIGATKALAKEIAKRKVTVNAVAPGFITSEMTEDIDEKELEKLIPAQRFGNSEEVADLVCFLASRKSAYITGEIININGGLYS